MTDHCKHQDPNAPAHEDPHTLPLTTDGERPSVALEREIVKVELVEFGIAIYHHDPLDGSPSTFIIDIDNESDNPQPLVIYRNDALVYDEIATAKEAHQ